MKLGPTSFPQNKFPINPLQSNLSFGTNRLDSSRVKFSKHARQRMEQRGFSENELVSGIKDGEAFRENKNSQRILIWEDNKPKHKVDPNDALMVASSKKNKIITVMDPWPDKWLLNTKGDLENTESHTLYHHLPDLQTKGKHSAGRKHK